MAKLSQLFLALALVAQFLAAPVLAQDNAKTAGFNSETSFPPELDSFRDDYLSAREIYGAQSAEFGEAARRFGSELLRVHEYRSAAQVYWEAIGAMEMAGATADEWYTTLINAARAASLSNDYRVADGYAQQALGVAQDRYGETSREVAMAHYELAYVHLRRSPDALEGFGRVRNQVTSESLFINRQVRGTSIEALTDLIDLHLRSAERMLRDVGLRDTMDYALVQALRGRFHAARQDNLRAEEALEAAIAQLETRGFVDDDLIHTYAALIHAMQSRSLRNRARAWRSLIEHAREQSLRRTYGEYIHVARIDAEMPRNIRGGFSIGIISYRFDISAEGRVENLETTTSITDQTAWAASTRDAMEGFAFAPRVRNGIAEGLQNQGVGFSMFAYRFMVVREAR